MIEKIEELEYQVKKLYRIIKLHKLDEIPIKYRKAFPKDDEEELFTIDKFKSKNIPNSLKVFELVYRNVECSEIELPKDPKEYNEAKERMKEYGEKARKEMINGGFKEQSKTDYELLMDEFKKNPNAFTYASGVKPPKPQV